MNLIDTPKTRGRGRWAAALLATATAAVLAFGAAQASPGGHGHRAEMGGPMAMMASGRHLDHLFDAVDASAEQRSQIRGIADAARSDLQAQHEGGRALHEQAMALFTQPSVDAREAEALRQQMLARHDTASQRMMQAMLEVSRVLSPEQRQKLGAMMAERREKMESRHRERGEHGEHGGRTLRGG